ncbi:MAG: cyclic nucleotide-binding domain-containing protein [Oscillospiraceae bacterium]|nr:cyclic nucleotide-binding domain-containing protein [Oscillospiraceae bacterium]
MMDIRTYRRGEVIFRQGDVGNCMYDIQEGKVGIFHDYKGPDEKQLAELFPNKIFGEMGLLDSAPRSATAVALEDSTVLHVIPEDDFYSYFEENPTMVLLLMQQMCSRLRRTSKDYLEACRAMYETVEAEKSGSEKSKTLKDKILKFCRRYKDFNYQAHT